MKFTFGLCIVFFLFGAYDQKLKKTSYLMIDYFQSLFKPLEKK